MADEAAKQRIEDQIVKISAATGINHHCIIPSGSYGILLTPDQMDTLFAALNEQGSERGFQNAIDLLRSTGESANVNGPNRNLTMWAVMVSAASFLEGVANTDLSAKEKCACRCLEGKHCGGCGHEGCGYTS